MTGTRIRPRRRARRRDGRATRPRAARSCRRLRRPAPGRRSAGEPVQRRICPQRAPDHEALDDRVGRRAEAVDEVLQRLVQPEDHRAAAMAVALGDQRGEPRPAVGAHRRELPPFGHHAEVVEARDRAQHRVVLGAGGRDRARRNDFQQQLVAAGARGFPQLQHALLLRDAQVDVVVGVVVDQALHDLLGRPVRERRADRARLVEAQRPRARQLDRAADPPAAPGGRRERVAAVRAAVDQHADVAFEMAIALDLFGRAHEQPLQRLDPRFVRAGLHREFVELAAMVERHHAQVVPFAARHRDAMQVRERAVRVDHGIAAAVEPVREFGRRRHRGRARMARHDDRAARVRDTCRFCPVAAAQQPRQQARQERVARAEHVEHLDAFAEKGRRIVDARGDVALDHAAAERAALDDQRGVRDPAHRLQRTDQVVGHAARDQEFLLGADQQIEFAEHLLQLPRHLRVRHVAVLARAARGQPPQHGPVVDVEDPHDAVAARVAERGQRRFARGRRGKMRAGDRERAAAGDEVLADLVGAHGHVRAVLAHEQQRERVAILQPEQHQRGEAFAVGLQLARVAAFALERLAHEAAHLLVADARDHRGLQPEPGDAERDVARRAAEIHLEAARVFQAAAVLLRIEIHGHAAEAGEIDGAVTRKVQQAHITYHARGRRSALPAV